MQIGILVAFTQLIPEHQVQVFGVFRARVKVWLVVVLSTEGPTLLLPDASNGICHVFTRDEHNRVSMPIYTHSIWMARVVDLAPIL